MVKRRKELDHIKHDNTGTALLEPPCIDDVYEVNVRL